MLTFIATLFESVVLHEVATLSGLAELDSRRPVVVKPKGLLTRLVRPIEIVNVNQ